uniref:C2H2-type domain-containing protein n=1 Tax=Oncorhynchus kisutch TaxID=8019 RepID=A0A8C7KFD7_ONCKI
MVSLSTVFIFPPPLSYLYPPLSYLYPPPILPVSPPYPTCIPPLSYLYPPPILPVSLLPYPTCIPPPLSYLYPSPFLPVSLSFPTCIPPLSYLYPFPTCIPPPLSSPILPLVEVYSGRWQVPLPQLRVLQTALCSFVQASACFPSDCEHVCYTLSSLALSAFELLLFLNRNKILQDPLKTILDSFQECFSQLERHQNIHLLQVGQIIREKGPWTNPILQAILKDSQLPRDEVDRYLGSEVPVFFELRVRYLLSSEMFTEAVVLAKTCSQHPVAGRHLFFRQAYLTCLLKMSDIDGKDAVDIVCNTESEESDETLLALCTAFLSQQLHRGDLYCMWDLVFIWSRLRLRVNPSKQAFLEESHRLLLSATNIRSIFSFIRVILAELGKDGLQFCVELCTHALQTNPCDAATMSLIYKTVAYLLPNDLEVCRACALLVFFLERTVEAYKTVFLLYTHPDQEYHVEAGPIGNHIRFEILQTLKRGLYFDPEFWNLLNLRTNCLKLMSEKKAALARMMMEDDGWVVREDTSQDSEDPSKVTENSPQKTQDTPTVSGDIRQTPGDGTLQENENSPLAYRCSLCNKVFKGKRVIAHAMYHFRRDQCMFCRMLFKNDLLAMMHLSQHIDKLKKGNLPPDIEEVRENCKAGMSDTLSTDSQPSPDTKLATEESEGKQSTQRVNGQRGRRRVKVEGTEGDEEENPCSSAKTMEDNTESQAVSVTQDRLSVSPLETSVQGKETPGICPVEGCTEIFTGKRRSLLGHILDDHRGDAKPLETTFLHGNGKCNICKKPVLTLQHYQHHILWHKGIPRHPCLHDGCKARFSAATEMRNHAKTHQPLLAVCCFPGCRERLACLPELNRHEQEHYRLPKEGKDESVSSTRVTNTTSVNVIKPDKDPRTTDPSPVSLKVTNTLRKLQVKRKPCVGKKMDAPNTPRSLKTSTVSKSKKCDPRNHKPATPKPPTNTPKPPTNTPKPPTNTPKPPTNTPKTPIKEEAKNSTFFGKINNRPYIRPPPTAYLDERYTTMPKRRKEMSWTPRFSPTRPDLVVEASGTTATPSVRRQRCAKCFLSFDSGEELQTHVSLKKCATLFGFDSDEDSKYKIVTCC